MNMEMHTTAAGDTQPIERNEYLCFLCAGWVADCSGRQGFEGIGIRDEWVDTIRRSCGSDCCCCCCVSNTI